MSDMIIALSYDQVYEVACLELKKAQSSEIELDIFSSIAYEAIQNQSFPVALAVKICEEFSDRELIFQTIQRPDCPSADVIKLASKMEKDDFYFKNILTGICSLPDLPLEQVLEFIKSINDDDGFPFRYPDDDVGSVEKVVQAVVSRSDFQAMPISELGDLVNRYCFHYESVYRHLVRHGFERPHV